MTSTLTTTAVVVGAARQGETLVDRNKWTDAVATRIKDALGALLEARDYADDLEWSAWDFALDFPSLRGLKISTSDLRWLIGKGLIEHAVEVTAPGDSERHFQREIRPLFCRTTCFVLTDAGVDVARTMHGNEITTEIRLDRLPPQPSLSRLTPSEPLLPQWDRNRQELRVGTVVVKRFKVPAANQEIMLAAFQEEQWPSRIDDPLPPRRDQCPKRRLQETIKSLNRSQKRPLIRFLGDGSGQGVCWEYRGELAPSAR